MEPKMSPDNGPSREAMIEYMEETSKIVASWPKWKREVLRPGRSDDKPTNKELDQAIDRHVKKSQEAVAKIPMSQRTIISKFEKMPVAEQIKTGLEQAIATTAPLAKGDIARLSDGTEVYVTGPLGSHPYYRCMRLGDGKIEIINHNELLYRTPICTQSNFKPFTLKPSQTALFVLAMNSPKGRFATISRNGSEKNYFR